MTNPRSTLHMRKLRPGEERDFPKVLLQVSSQVLASTAQNVAYRGSQRMKHLLSISDFLKLRPLLSISHSLLQYYNVLLAPWSRSETNTGAQKPVPALAQVPAFRDGWSNLGSVQPAPLQSFHCTPDTNMSFLILNSKNSLNSSIS